MSKHKLAVVYARYSSHRQGEQSIEGQLAAARDYATANGLTIIHEYIDRAATGRNDNRNAFQEMLKDTSKKQFDTIILWKIDRFGRNREEIAFNKYRCKRNGVKVVYVAESIPNSPEGVILESVLEGMAEYYSLQLSQNILRGQRASAEKCQSTGGNRPLGYLTSSDKKFIIDPDTAPTVRMIFNMYAKGSTCTEIINALNKKGLRTLRGGKFNKNSLRSILKNEKYIGVYKYKDEVRIENGVPAIIDKDTFYKVQNMLKVNKRAPAHKWSKVDYLLTDKLFCGKCGSKMVGESGTSKTGKKHNYYICTKKKRQRTCDKKAVKQQYIEELVISHINKILQDNELLNFIADSVYSYYLEQNKENDYAASLNSKLSQINQAISNVIKAIEAGIINNITKQRIDELDAQHTEIVAEIADLERAKTLQLTREQILFFLCSFRDMDISDQECRKRLVDTFVNAIFVYDDKVIGTFNYSGDKRTITLAEIDSVETMGKVFVHCAPCSTIVLKTRVNAGFFIFIHEFYTNFYIFSNILITLSSSLGYKCEYAFQVISILECPNLLAIS